VKIRKDSAQENNLKTMKLLSELKNITFYLSITSIFGIIIIILAFYFKLYQPITHKRIFLPTRTNEIKMETVKPTENTLQPLYPPVNTINA
jgi:hypothetical protein